MSNAVNAAHPMLLLRAALPDFAADGIRRKITAATAARGLEAAGGGAAKKCVMNYYPPIKVHVDFFLSFFILLRRLLLLLSVDIRNTKAGVSRLQL